MEQLETANAEPYNNQTAVELFDYFHDWASTSTYLYFGGSSSTVKKPLFAAYGALLLGSFFLIKPVKLAW